ncbi:hypothetical protein DPV78_006789 [Talaromyces pinophilus]|nr:hypothetical protein DPV78_006789 [Talaromyces pinophilus]
MTPLKTIEPVPSLGVQRICIFGLGRITMPPQKSTSYHGYRGLAASFPSICPPAFSNQTASRNYTARLGFTEPSPYDSADDRVNAFLTLWPLDFELTTFAVRWADYLHVWLGIYTVIHRFQMAILPERFHLHQTLYPKYQTTVDGTANLSLQGYVVANPVNGEGQVPGQFRLTFSGVIDKYHSDVLRNYTSTPSWLRTVGFNNNSENTGYTNTTSGSSHLMGSLLLNAIVSALWLMIQ